MCVSAGRCNSPPARLSPTTSVCNNDQICQETWKKKLPINQSINLLFIKYIQRPHKVFLQNQKEKPTDPFGASMTRQWPGKKKKKKSPLGRNLEQTATLEVGQSRQCSTKHGDRDEVLCLM